MTFHRVSRVRMDSAAKMNINIPLITSVLPLAEDIWPELDRVLAELPPTLCRRKTACCALLPQMSLVEAGRLMMKVDRFPFEDREVIWRRLIEYFHLNAAKIMGCPFLSDHACLVYAVRPFGCRAYGLLSPGAYRRQAEAAVASQRAVQQAWASMGVSLPGEVVEHRPAYCREVTITDGHPPEDREIKAVESRVQDLNRRLASPAQVFDRQYYSDLSFLVTASLWGLDTSLKNKVSVVREFTETGQSPSLDYLIIKLSDIILK